MISITILGSGNVAQNLFEAFLPQDSVSIVQVVGRKLSGLGYFTGRTNLATYGEELRPADVYIMAINDDAIRDVSNTLKIKGLLAHTSGSVPLSALNSHHSIGVFYPLQTFTAGKTLDFSNIPICVEASHAGDLELLHSLGAVVSSKVQTIPSYKRRALHLSAVFVNNFTNYMYGIGHEICTENNLQFSLLQPLIKETAEKIMLVDPYEAQTGPAKRGDQKTLHAHLSLLKDKNHREIYTLLSNSINASFQIRKDKS